MKIKSKVIITAVLSFVMALATIFGFGTLKQEKVGFNGIYAGEFVALAEETQGEVGVVQGKLSTDGNYLLLATPLTITDFNAYTAVGYEITKDGQALVAEGLESDGYYTGITVKTTSGTITWTMEQIFGASATGMIVAEIEYSAESNYSVKPYAIKNDVKVYGTNSEIVNKESTDGAYVLYEEDFDDIVSRVDLVSGDNNSLNSTDGWIYSKKSNNGSAYVENGRLYFQGSAYDVIYRDGGQVWGNYTLEADFCYAQDSAGWGAMLFNVHSDTKFQRATISQSSGNGSVYGYIDGDWINEIDANKANLTDKGYTLPQKGEAYRMKIVVENKTADFYYAMLDANGSMTTDWLHIISIDNIPANAQTGSIGFMTGTSKLGKYWVDNIKCYSYTDVSFTEDFDSYEDTTLTPSAVNSVLGLNYLRQKSGGTASVTNGQLKLTSAKSSLDVVLFNTSKNWTNYVVETDITIHENGTWVGLLYRSQDRDNFQKGGVGINDRAMLNGKYGGQWYNDVEGVTKIDYDAGLTKDVAFRIKISVEEYAAKLYYATYDAGSGELSDWTFVMGHEDRLHEDQISGMIGFGLYSQAEVTFDNVVVRRGTDRVMNADANVADIYEPQTGIVNPPVVVQKVASALPATTGRRSAVLLTEIDADINVVNSSGQALVSVDKFIDDYRNYFIPAFVIDSQSEATALAKKIKDKNLIDCYVVASAKDAELVRSVRLANEVTAKISGALQFDDLSNAEARKSAMALAVDNMSYVVISKTVLDEESSHYFNVRQIAAWCEVETAVDVYGSIAFGYHGVVATDSALVYDVYESITETTVSGKPVIIAHRGANEKVGYPENTMMGFKAAIEQFGADAIEIDVRITSDGYLYLMHDATVDRTTNGTGSGANFTLAELNALVVDEIAGKETEVPTFEELLQYVQGTDIVVYAHINAKSDVVMASFNYLIDKYDCKDNVVAFIGGEYVETYNSNVTRTASNPAYNFVDAPVAMSGIVYTAGNVKILSGLYTEQEGIEAMREKLNAYNYQPLFYAYSKQGTMWASESFYYNLSARGFVNMHSIVDGQSAMDSTALTVSGAVGYLTNDIDHSSDYHYIIDVTDVQLNVGQTFPLNGNLKMTVGEKEITLKVIYMSGDELIMTENGYTLDKAGSVTVVFCAESTTKGNTTYSVLSKPVTLTFIEE